MLVHELGSNVVDPAAIVRRRRLQAAVKDNRATRERGGGDHGGGVDAPAADVALQLVEINALRRVALSGFGSSRDLIRRPYNPSTSPA